MKNVFLKLKSYFIGNNDASLSMDFNGISKFSPIIILGGFFICTILMFCIGPQVWPVSNPFKLYSFLFLCFVALISGYFVAVLKTKTYQKSININIEHLVLFGVIVFLVTYIPTVYVTTGKFYPDIYTGITNTGLAYRYSKYYNLTMSPIPLYIKMLLSPFMFFVMPITIYFMPKLSLKGKILGILVIVLTTFLGIAQGVNKNVADIAAQLVLALMILFFAGTTKDNIIKYRVKIVSIVLLVCFLFFMYYANSMTNRVSADVIQNEQGEEIDPDEIPKKDIFENIEIDESLLTDNMQSFSLFSVATERENDLFRKVLPPRIMSIYSYLCSYLSHGYYGLSLALEEDFTSTYGLGFSDFFRHNFLKVVGAAESEADIKAQTYYGKISEKGWHVGAVWSTFFVYPASDISFIGTIFLVFIIGFLLGLSWKDSVTTQNPFAIASFFGLSTMVFYFSANNQMFQGGENFIAFIAMLICWFVTRVYHIKKSSKGF